MNCHCNIMSCFTLNKKLGILGISSQRDMSRNCKLYKSYVKSPNIKQIKEKDFCKN